MLSIIEFGADAITEARTGISFWRGERQPARSSVLRLGILSKDFRIPNGYNVINYEHS